MDGSILIVDDDPRILETLGRNLTQAGYTVLAASGGEEAIQIHQREWPDIVLVDVRMPRVDGFEVLRAVRERDPEAEVILITGHGDMDTSITALREGASDFIPKPVEQEMLDAALQRARDRLRLKRELRAARAALEQYALDLEARNRELRQAQARLVYEANLALLRSLALGLVHEISNPVAAIKLMALVTGQHPDADESIRENMDKIDWEASRISAVVDRIFDVPQPGLAEVRRLDVNEVVQAALDAAHEQGLLGAAGDITLEVDLAPDIPLVLGRPDHLRQAFLNVILNGVEALARNDPGRHRLLAVSTARDVSLGEGVLPDEGLPVVRVRFVDTGPGIPEDALERAFDPDYTTKVKHGEIQGLGLGLWAARAVVEAHGGRMMLRNRQQESGVEVTMDLPVEVEAVRKTG